MGHNLPNLLVEKNCSPVTVGGTLKMELENFASLMDFCARTVSTQYILRSRENTDKTITSPTSLP